MAIVWGTLDRHMAIELCQEKKIFRLNSSIVELYSRDMDLKHTGQVDHIANGHGRWCALNNAGYADLTFRSSPIL